MTKNVFVLLDVETKIVTIFLNKPERKNVLDPENGRKNQELLKGLI